MKRILVELLAFTMLLSSIFALPACAETVLKDGIEVMLTTDKEIYDSLDVINAKLTVKNTNSFDVENVSMEIKAPQGYMLNSDGETKIGELSAGEMQQQQTGMRDTEAPVPVLPQTGDNSHGMLWGLLFVLSLAAVCVLVICHPQGKRIISLLLCVVLVAPYMLDVVPAMAQEELATEMIMVSKEVLVNGETVTLTGMVTYQAAEQTVAETAENTSAFGLKINEVADSVKVREGDTLSFTGTISATEGATISAVQVFVYDATTEVPYTMGEKYYAVDGLNVAQFDLASVPEMTVGEMFGESDYALMEGGSYAVMFYATDSNGNSFADMDLIASGNQGPVINVRVLMDPANCDHSAKEYVYERDDYTASRVTDSGDGLTHLVEDSYKRYCADCGAYLMNIWGSGAAQEHTMADGVCTGCGYAAVPMMFVIKNSLDTIAFTSYPDSISVGGTFTVSWEGGYSDTYIVNVKLLDGEPGYEDYEEGMSLVLNQKQSASIITFTVPTSAKVGQYVKVHAYGMTDDVQTEAGNQVYLQITSSCPHKNKFTSIYNVQVPVDDEYHGRALYSYTYCKDCGTLLEERVDYTTNEPEEHDFDYNGECYYCGYVTELECDHDLVAQDGMVLTSYESNFGTELQHIKHVRYDMLCSKCGYRDYYWTSGYEDHTFDSNGVCACYYENVTGCAHNSFQKIKIGSTEYDADWAISTPEKPEMVHHIARSTYIVKCTICGAQSDEECTDNVYEEHEFGSNHVCTLCGYENPTATGDTELPKIGKITSSAGNSVMDGVRTTISASVSDNNRLKYVALYYDGSIQDEIYNPIVSANEEVDVSMTAFFSVLTGKEHTITVKACDIDGNWAEKEMTLEVYCPHENMREMGPWITYEPIEGDTNEHLVKTRTKYLCSHCDEVVKDETVNTRDAHSMENGFCTECGYGESVEDDSDRTGPEINKVQVCSEDGSFAVGVPLIYRAEVSDDVELFRYMLYINDSLADAGSLSGTEDVVEFSTTELPVGEYYFKLTVYDMAENEWSHVLSLPVEIVEKEESDCQHTEYTDFYNPNIEIKYTDNKDGKTHIWQNGYDRICNACQVKFDVVYGAENTADHDYTNGNICPCGYDRSNCQHTPGEVKTYNRHIFAPFDAEQHQTTAIVWDMVCSSCGLTYEETDTVGDVENPVGLKYDHEWENGKCKIGGCEYQCAHAFEDIMLPDGNHKAENGIWESKGESGHWCTSIEWWEKCVNCGLEQKYTQNDPYKGEVQEHMMNALIKKYYNYDDNAHWLVGEKWQCTADGCDYDNYVEVENDAHEAHADDANGKCTVCGAQKITHDSGKNDGASDYGESGTIIDDVYDLYFKNYCEIVMENNKVDVIVSMLPWEINGYIYDLAKFDFFGLGDRINEAMNDPESELLYEGILKSLTDNSQEDTVTDNVLAVADLGYKVTKNTWKGYKLGVNAVLQALSGEQLPSELAKVDSYLSRFGYGLSVAKELDQSWDNVMLLAEIAGQYSEKLDFLDNCIAESDGKLKAVYQRIRDELEREYNDSFARVKNFVNQNPEEVLFSFSTMKVVLNANGVNVDKAFASAMKNLSARQAEQAAIKSGKSLSDAIKAGEKAYNNTNALLIAHGITVLVADEVFAGDDIYNLAPQIRREEKNLDEMLENLRSNYDEYIGNPTRDNAMQLKNEAIMYAKYSISVLETCDNYLDCLVNADTRDDGKDHVKQGISILNQSIDWIEKAYSKMTFEN